MEKIKNNNDLTNGLQDTLVNISMLMSERNSRVKTKEYFDSNLRDYGQPQKSQYENNDYFFRTFQQSSVRRANKKENNSKLKISTRHNFDRNNIDKQFSKTERNNDYENNISTCEYRGAFSIFKYKKLNATKYSKDRIENSNSLKSYGQYCNNISKYDKKSKQKLSNFKEGKNLKQTELLQNLNISNQLTLDMKLQNKFKNSYSSNNKKTLNLEQKYSQSALHNKETILNGNSYTVRKNSENKLIYPMKQSTKTQNNSIKEKSKINPVSFYTMGIKNPQKTSAFKNTMSIDANKLGLDDFILSQCQGQGRFGKVYMAQHRFTNFLCAIKIIKKASVRFMLPQLIQELKIQLYARHSNIVQMYGYFDTQEDIFLILQYMEQGSLFSRLKLLQSIPQTELIRITSQIVSAVFYLHNEGIIHRDIKPENIVRSHMINKICDFGWSTYQTKNRRKTYCGTLDYACPQLLEGLSYDYSVDIWAIGVLTFEMATGIAPFYHISKKQTIKKITTEQLKFSEKVSLKARKFIQKALVKNPQKRVCIKELIQDPFLALNQ